jgi:hypothetical protein
MTAAAAREILLSAQWNEQNFNAAGPSTAVVVQVSVQKPDAKWATGQQPICPARLVSNTFAVRYKNWKFVKTTTTEGSPQFVSPEARIAPVLAKAGSEADDENLCLGFSILFSTN